MTRALVTGGSSPIGAAIAERLAADGMHVIVHAHSNAEAARAVAARIEAAGGSAETLVMDLLAPSAPDRIAALADPDPVQVLVHCAGGPADMPFAAMDWEDWRRVIDVNLNSFFIAARPLMLPMMRSRWGRIVAISSLAAVAGNRGQAAYAAAKGGLLPLAKTLSREYGSRGITANVVAPGLIDTPETRALPNYEALTSMTAVGRAGTPQEVAALVGFLASRQSGYLTGQLIQLDGGTV